MKKLPIFLMIMLLACSVSAKSVRQFQLSFLDEFEQPITTITSITVFNAGLGTSPTIYADRGALRTMTNPITSGSTNSTFLPTLGIVTWFQTEPDYKVTVTDGTKTLTVDNRNERNTQFAWYDNYIGTAASLSVGDNQSITVGTDSDFVLAWVNASDFMSWIPAADGSAFNLGTSGTGANVDFNWFVGTALGIKGDEGAATLVIDGLTTSINTDSNFATNINTGSSTGAVTIGSATAGNISIDTTTTIAVNADDSYTLTVSAGSISATATGAASDITLSAGDVMTLTSVDTKIFDGAAAETWIIEGTADASEATVVFTDPTADVTWTFPTAAADTFAVMASTLATNAPEIVNSVSGGTNQLIYEGTADASECILTAADATADVIYTLPDAAAATYGIMPSSLATNAVDIANSVTGGTSQLVFEGSTADTEESIIQATDPTADIIWILPDGATDSFAIVGSTLTTNIAEAANSFWGGTNQIIMEGASVDAFETIITPNDATADATISLPDDTGDIIYAPPGVVDYSAGAGALPITHVIITYESTGGAEALTLADGKPGQVLQVNHDTDGGNGVITPATALGYTSVDLADDGDMVTFMFVDTQGWIIIGTAGNAAPPVVTP